MTTFRIGQRVRIKSLPNLKMQHLVGCEGVLLGMSLVYELHWYVDVNGDKSFSPDGVRHSFHECRLEPLTDSCDLVSWESMRELWMPEHLREGA